ncbi:uncharacterized protein LOC134195685 [Corticium candelabrum]|uniref:uncharacterized protein LOC134195685 n=1 Tax=Corticium candelabrum TaxID=121492 RepID=UPI002E2571C9|nr:uncharacterized protein LOC134195685 [Corticium candelabrum]
MADEASFLSTPLDCFLALLLLPTFAWDLIVGFSGLAVFALVNSKETEEQDDTETDSHSLAWLIIKVVLALLVVPSLLVDLIMLIGRAVAGIVLMIVSLDVDMRLKPKLGFKTGCLDKQQMEAMAASPS